MFMAIITVTSKVVIMEKFGKCHRSTICGISGHFALCGSLSMKVDWSANLPHQIVTGQNITQIRIIFIIGLE